MAARHHNNLNGSDNDHDDGSDNDHDDFAAGHGTADCWASRPSDGFSHLHRIAAGLTQERHCGTGGNRADFY